MSKRKTQASKAVTGTTTGRGRSSVVGSSAVLNNDALTKRDALIEQYHDFVDMVVGRLIRTMGFPHSLREDFVSAGFLGLVEAATRFDPSKGYEFRSFAFLRIRGAIIDYIRSSCELSGAAYRVFKALEAAHEMRAEELDRSIRVPRDPRQRATEAVEHLAKSAVAFRLTALKGSLIKAEGESPDDPEKKLEEKRASQKIRAIVATLPEKERTIVEQYYFHDRKLTDVAAQYAGLSKSWVSRLHDRALEILRQKIHETAPELIQ